MISEVVTVLAAVELCRLPVPRTVSTTPRVSTVNAARRATMAMPSTDPAGPARVLTPTGPGLATDFSSQKASFATGCVVNGGNVQCSCKAGYTGTQCER
ncbi:hypothetical protein P7K49_028266 [Saguinus oedipus]|uniref:EGF-like domain-containing protein n=1 Tax=Saguinus oedipus TaxID=9490 RepID=A0ABQ9UBQ6_SAGOE|nr:hypothetical protein P7K49_028266 [Saguinus oedipus]